MKKDQKEERKKRKIADLFLQNHIIDFNETFFFFHKKVSTLHSLERILEMELKKLNLKGVLKSFYYFFKVDH